MLSDIKWLLNQKGQHTRGSLELVVSVESSYMGKEHLKPSSVRVWQKRKEGGDEGIL